MKAWRRAGGLGPPAPPAPTGYLNATAAIFVDGDGCQISLDGISVDALTDATGFTLNGSAASSADIGVGDAFMFVSLVGGCGLGVTVAYDGSGGFGSIVNPFSLVIS